MLLTFSFLRYKFRNEHHSELAASPNRYHAIPPVVSNAPVQDGRFAVPAVNNVKPGVKPLLEISFNPETLKQNEVQRKVVIEENQGRATFGIPVSASKSSSEYVQMNKITFVVWRMQSWTIALMRAYKDIHSCTDA